MSQKSGLEILGLSNSRGPASDRHEVPKFMYYGTSYPIRVAHLILRPNLRMGNWMHIKVISYVYSKGGQRANISGQKWLREGFHGITRASSGELA